MMNSKWDVWSYTLTQGDLNYNGRFFLQFKNINGYNLALQLNGVSLDIIWPNRKMVRGNKVNERYWDTKRAEKNEMECEKKR